MNDRGAGSVLTVGLIGAVVALTLVALPASLALAARQSLVGAADAAALAAADAASGAVPGVPCDRAKQAAGANEAEMSACQVDGYVATVAVERTVLGLRVVATATAGPPDSQPETSGAD